MHHLRAAAASRHDTALWNDRNDDNDNHHHHHHHHRRAIISKKQIVIAEADAARNIYGSEPNLPNETNHSIHKTGHLLEPQVDRDNDIYPTNDIDRDEKILKMDHTDEYKINSSSDTHFHSNQFDTDSIISVTDDYRPPSDSIYNFSTQDPPAQEKEQIQHDSGHNTTADFVGTNSYDDANDEWRDLDFDDDDAGGNNSHNNQSSDDSDDHDGDDDDTETEYELNKTNGELGEENGDADEEGNNDLRNAFVRHRRVTLEFIAMIEQEIYQNSLENSDDDEDAENIDVYDSMDPEREFFAPYYDEEPQAVRKRRTSKTDTVDDNDQDTKENEVVEVKTYKNYGSSRPVTVITTASELRSFCSKLVQSAQTNLTDHNNDPNAYAVGMDVEYCSLELDIRNNLPAMIQLCGPTKTDGPVGLIWIDRFPDHGRDLLTNAHAYEPLLKIFADPKLLKVGVSLSYDTLNIARWCGITEKKDVEYFFSGIVNIDEIQDNDNVRNKSLQAMAELVLHRNLPKIKGYRRSLKDRIRRAPTAHWRNDNITGLMKSYAANDVACSIDVWMRIHNLTLLNKAAKKKKEKGLTKIKEQQQDGIDM